MSGDELAARLTELELARDDLEARLRRFEDERELRELLSRYGFTADLGRSREYVELYTEDGRINLGTGRWGAEGSGPNGAHTGREALYENFILAPPHKCIEGYCQHHALTGPLIFHINGDDAVAEGYSLVVVQSDENERRARSCRPVRREINIAGANFNRWTFRRVDGRWRIFERFNREIGSPEIHDVIINSLRSTRPDAELAAS
jgi:hypothetical protein